MKCDRCLSITILFSNLAIGVAQYYVCQNCSHLFENWCLNNSEEQPKIEFQQLPYQTSHIVGTTSLPSGTNYNLSFGSIDSNSYKL